MARTGKGSKVSKQRRDRVSHALLSSNPFLWMDIDIRGIGGDER